MRKIDLSGQKFGRLLVICDTGKRDNSGDIIYYCKCDCGNYKEISRRALRRPKVSCGCSVYIKRFGVPQRRNDPLYWVWSSMKDRCLNPNCKSFKYYGGKGIKVCQEWLTYENFREWAFANGYIHLDGKFGNKLSIDRIDPNGDYEPFNCRWITVSENISLMAQERWKKAKAEG